jgi:hypothetical protein
MNKRRQNHGPTNTPVLQYSITPGFACLKAESQKRNPL